MCPVCGHCVGRSDGAECNGTFIGALVTHDTHALDGEQDCSGLPYFVIEVPVAEAADENVVGVLKDAYFLGGDVTEDSNGKAGSGEGMTLDDMIGLTKIAAAAAHFFFEQPPQRLAKFEVHFFRKTAHIVMALDSRAGD